MSGLAAVIRFDGAPPEQATVAAMLATMPHRAPDGAMQVAQGPAAIGHALMRVMAETAPQPLSLPEAGLVLAMDGFFANHASLKADLVARGVRLRYGDDAELAVHAYALWAADCAVRFEGEFAIVVWDAQRHQAICLRDHHGLRPLFYHCDGARLVVASDIAAVLAALPAAPPANLDWLAEVAGDIPCTRDETAWTGIQRLLPAHILRFGCEGLRLHEYWRLDPSRSIRHRTIADYVAHYRTVLEECVGAAARSHLPVACEVSGGLDSSSVFAIANALRDAGKLPAPDLRGYTLAGPPGTMADEVDFARAVAAHCGTRFHENALFCPDLGWFAQTARDTGDCPPFPNAAMSLGLDRQIAADGCRVSLTGLGGDQWLDGTHFYYGDLLRQGELRRWGVALREDMRALGASRAIAMAMRLGPGSFLPHGLRQGLNRFRGAARVQESPAWLTPTAQTALSARHARYEAGMPRDYRASYKLRKLLYPGWAAILDQASSQRARTGLEMRSPMLSRAFIEFCAALPQDLLLRGGERKFIHRQAMDGLLPATVLTRESKAEFSVTYRHLIAAIARECAVLPEDGSTGPVNHLGALALFNKNCDAVAIDEWPTGEIWGVYVSLLMMRLAQTIQ